MRTGDLAPDFTLTDHTGTTFTLSSVLANGPVVLFFYPAAMSKGCTKESCYFRDLDSEFAALGAQRVGISMDSVTKQARFNDAHQLGYPLLSDARGVVASRYGVKRPLDILRVRRATFVIGTDQRILDVITSELSMEVHADRALAALRA